MKLFLLFIGLVLSLNAHSQIDSINYNKLTITFEDTVAFDSAQINYNIQGIVETGISSLDELFIIYGVTSMYYTLDYARPHFPKTFSIVFNTGSVYSFKSQLQSLSSLFKLVEFCYTGISLGCTPTGTPPNDLGGAYSNENLMDLIGGECAWDISKSGPSIKIAIIDAIYQTYDESLDNDDIDDKIISYFNLTGGTAYSHGIAVSGNATAETNNNYGIASIGYNASVMAYNISTGNDSSPWVDADKAVDAIYHAVDNGATVINMSFTFRTSSYKVAAVQYAIDHNVFVIQAAGNELGLDPGCGISGNFCVTATNLDDEHISTFAHGTSGDLCAPDRGYNVLYPGDFFGLPGGGTSLSAPIVSGVVALMVGANPCLTVADIEIILKSTAVNIDAIPSNVPYAGLLGAGRVDAYESVLKAYGINTVEITSNTTWNTQSYNRIKESLTVKSGNILTVKGKVVMDEDASIIIEKGAKLIVDGGTITKSCDGLWQGIEVWGNSSYTAHPTKNDIVTGAYPSSAAHHGVVWIKNGGTIEFARNAITTSKYDDYANQNYYGGIVLAESSTFRNNKRSTEFMKYDYYPYDADDDNISEFKNCTFIIDDEYPATETFAYHVSLWDVDGLIFTDNVYLDHRTTATGSTQAIYSIDATYKVNSILCSPPPPNTCTGDYNYFNGFLRGVHAANANYRPLNIEINTGIFEDNTRGILLSNVKNSLIINNTFRIQDNTVNSYGLYLEDCENYQVENNYFTSLAGFDGLAPFNAGLYAANNSNAHTLVYRNIFEGLETGIRCQVNNKNLQIKCNTFLSEINRYHVYATSGLLGHQGKCLTVGNPPEDRVRAPAGNIFSHDCIYTEGDFKIHTGIPELKYRHHDDPVYTPQCFTTPNIILNNCMIDPDEGGYVACPSALPGSGEALMAGGGSSASELLAEYNVTAEIISGLEEMIAAAESEAEENDDLLYFTAINEQLANTIVSSYITELKPDSAIWFLEQQATDEAKETIVQIYLMTEEFTAAETALKNVNNSTIEGVDFVTLYEVLIPVAAEGRTILQLGKKEISIIESLAGKQSPSGVAAENILQFINQTDYPEVFDAELPEDLRLLQQENSDSEIHMFPNPADNTLYISIASNLDEIKYVFVAYSLNGQKIYETSLDKTNTAINISNWSKGIYLCEVWADGIIIFTEKLVKE